MANNKQQKAEKPTSFRLSPEVIQALDEGARLFGYTRKSWIEFLALSAVSGKPHTLSKDNASISISSTKTL